MSTLEKVTQLKRQGFNDEQIIDQLKQEKISPKEINDAISQAQIKSAVSRENNLDFDRMEPSMMEQPEDLEEVPIPESVSNHYKSKTKEIYEYENKQPEEYELPKLQRSIPISRPQKAQEYQKGYQQQTQEYPPQEAQQTYQQQTQEYPQQYSSYDSTSYTDTDTMIEISEQVFDEKISETLTQIESINKFKVITESKLENFENRLRKIESIIDKLQISILEKIGSYGENLESIKNEMGMMQDSFSKMVNPIAERNQQKSERLSKSVEDYAAEIPEDESETSTITSDISSIISRPKKINKKISKRKY